MGLPPPLLQDPSKAARNLRPEDLPNELLSLVDNLRGVPESEKSSSTAQLYSCKLSSNPGSTSELNRTKQDHVRRDPCRYGQ